MVSYYDFVLVFIPVLLLGVPGVLVGIHGLDLTLAAPIGGAIAAGLVGHAMFVRAPRGGSRPGAADPAFIPGAD